VLPILAAVALIAIAMIPFAGLWWINRRYGEAHPDWAAAWRAADRPTRRRVQKAMRRGAMTNDPDDARLLIGLAGRADAWQGRRFTGRRQAFVGVVLVAGLAIALLTGDIRQAVRLVVTGGGLVIVHWFVINPLRQRRQRAVAANRHVVGKS
jgi:hypothetical protein